MGQIRHLPADERPGVSIRLAVEKKLKLENYVGVKNSSKHAVQLRYNNAVCSY
jgi:hypothetical protein